MTSESANKIAFGMSVCFDVAKYPTEVSLTANILLLSQTF